MKNISPYLFSVGVADEERLLIQNRLCDPYTKHFTQDYFSSLQGKTILDIGCGTGLISCFWAQQIGSKGRVVAIDISAEQLEIAKTIAKKNRLSNIEFIQLDAIELDIIKEKFDIVYCRFFLMHVLNQQTIMEKMLFHVKPGGHLFCEEVLSYESFYSDPESNAFQEWKNLILEQPKISKTNYFIGKQLNSVFHKMNLQKIKSKICQPIIREEHDKGYFYLGFTEEGKKKFVDANIITLTRLDQILTNLKDEILNKPWVGSAVQYIQILGQKPI